MFQPPRSSVDIGFWEALHQLKLDKLRLESPFIHISAIITPAPAATTAGSTSSSSSGSSSGVGGGGLRVDKASFDENRGGSGDNTTATSTTTSTTISTTTSTTTATTKGQFIARGAFINVNTIEEFQKLNKKALIDRTGKDLWDRY
jgi:hypothetical protein